MNREGRRISGGDNCSGGCSGSGSGIGFWRFLGKYLGTEQKLPYWEPTGENPWISGPEYIPTLSLCANGPTPTGRGGTSV